MPKSTVALKIARRRVVLAGNRRASAASRLLRTSAIDADTFHSEYRERPKHDTDVDQSLSGAELDRLARRYEDDTRELEARLEAFESLIETGDIDPTTPVARPARKVRSSSRL